MNELYDMLSIIDKMRKRRLGEYVLKSGIKQKIEEIARSDTLANLAKTYPKFRSVLSAVKRVKEKVDSDTIRNLLECIINIVDDTHLSTVIELSDSSIMLYNDLVEVYENLRDELYHKRGNDKEMMEREGVFMSSHDAMNPNGGCRPLSGSARQQ